MHHQIQEDEIFVFGSNYDGRHGRGAAATAKRYYGAKQGQGEGLMGRSYGIPTKGHDLRYSLSISKIRQHVNIFIEFAHEHPEMKFFVTAIGTGLAGYKHEEIAPLFKDAPTNCRLPPEWVEILN